MPSIASVVNPVAAAAREGLTGNPKSLPAWLFYDEPGSLLFERITALPEYYLTRTERAIFLEHADAILAGVDGLVTIAELGAGSAAKTGLLLEAATRRQGAVLYQPIDVSPSALEIAAENMEQIPGVTVRTQIANYITEPYLLERPHGTRLLALYIGSSIGNFSPVQALQVLRGLRTRLQPRDALLLGTDLAPGLSKTVATLIAAYDDAEEVTAAFNRNILLHLNEKLHTDFQPECFAHEARWNARESRIEMHLRSLTVQEVRLPSDGTDGAALIRFAEGETIHTENSYKFTEGSLTRLLGEAGFSVAQTFTDAEKLFAVTLAIVT